MEPSKQETQDVIVSDNNKQQHSFWRRFGTKLIIYTGSTAAVTHFGIPLVFGWFGFSSAGVAAGTWVASWQSTHILSSVFGLMQSTTATGAANLCLTTGTTGAAAMKAWVDAKKNPDKTKDGKLKSKL